MKRDLDPAEFIVKVVFWKLLCLAMAAIPIWAMVTQSKPAGTFEKCVMYPLSASFVLFAIFTELGDG